MNKQESKIYFKKWKIYFALLVGLTFSVFLLYKSLNEVQFVEANNHKGTHNWVDANNNKKIDFNLENEFRISKNGSYRKKTKSEFLQEINWSTSSFLFLGLALVFMFGRDFAYMWRIRILTKNQLTWKKSFFVIMLWEFASAVSPGIVGGSAVAMFILKKEKITLGKSTSIVVLTAMFDNLFYVLLIPIVFIFISPTLLFPENTSLDKSIEFIFWFGFSVILSICFVLFLSIFYFPSLIKNFLKLLFSLPFLKKWKESALKLGEEVSITSKEFKNEPFIFWIKVYLATFISWMSRYLVINCILAAFLSLSFLDHFFILGKQLVLWIFLLISPTPGASGIAEYAFSELMQGFGSTPFLITSLAILWRLISYFPYLIIGSFILPSWLKK